jgi:chemotaxis signal transduction protein
VIPQVSLLELIRLEGDSTDKRIELVHGTPVYRRRGTLLPIAYLNQVLGLKSPEQTEASSIVVLQAEDRQFGLVVVGINDTQEIVVKPLGKQLKGLSVYAGATIMGDGRVALILDVPGIGQRSGALTGLSEQSRAATEQKTQSAAIEQQRLLLFRAGAFERLAIPLSLVARLEEFPPSSIEQAGGSQVVQYRNRILPLVPLSGVLEPEQATPAASNEAVQVIVFNDGDRNVVSAASEQVSTNVSSVASASQQMQASIREIAKNANESARVAKNAVSVAHTTNETVKKLGESSQEIGNVIKVITSIAQQTNLLALNATIEAARAGEAGKGFAVVANEVKELAKQTAKATEEISQKIEAIQGDTKGAVKAIEEIGAIINQVNDISNNIASAVEEQTVTTNEIGRSVAEAAKGVGDIAKNIGGVASAAKDTTQGASDTQKAAQELSQMAARLQKVVSHFSI